MAIDTADRLTTPVVFIIFNRPTPTAKVFAAIQAARPPKLFVIADGPRANVASDRDNCAAARVIVDLVDWPCEVAKRFANANLGLRRNVAEGLDWVFAQSERAIILEDDCLPDPSFFPFCEELLERYAEDRHVAMIGGTNLDPEHAAPRGEDSYYFSRFWQIWGWATWRRVWQLCDHEMKEWPELRRSCWLRGKVATGTAANFWRRYLDDSYARNRDSLKTRDVPCIFASWQRDMLSIIPRKNLISNIGFGREATHTKSQTRMARLPDESNRLPVAASERKNREHGGRSLRPGRILRGTTRWQRLFWKLRVPLPIWLVRRVMRWLGR